MNQYLYTVQPLHQGIVQNPSAEDMFTLSAHDAYIRQLMQSGVAFFAGNVNTHDNQHLGLCIYQAEDDAQAAQIVHADPAVQSKLLRGCWYPYRIALWNPQVMQLSASQHHYLYRIQPSRPEMLTENSTPAEDEAVAAHFHYLKELTEQGVFCVVGRTLNSDYSSFGIGVLRADSDEEAWTIARNDPAIVQRVMRLEVLPFLVMTTQQGTHS